MSILEELKEKLEEQIAEQHANKRMAAELRKSTGLADNDRAWIEVHEKHPREVELMSEMINDIIIATDPHIRLFQKAVLVMPESVRELAFDRLTAASAVNVLATIDQVNDVLTKKP